MRRPHDRDLDADPSTLQLERIDRIERHIEQVHAELNRATISLVEERRLFREALVTIRAVVTKVQGMPGENYQERAALLRKTTSVIDRLLQRLS